MCVLLKLSNHHAMIAFMDNSA